MAAGKELPQTPRSNEAAQFERTKTASHVSHVIRDWIERTGLNKALQLRAIDQAQYVLRRAERNGTLPRGEVPRDLSEADIIMHCYPTDPKPHDSDALAVVNWYGRWMAIATYHLLPEARGWDEALSMLIRELKRK